MKYNCGTYIYSQSLEEYFWYYILEFVTMTGEFWKAIKERWFGTTLRKSDWCEFSRILHHTGIVYIMKKDEAGGVWNKKRGANKDKTPDNMKFTV